MESIRNIVVFSASFGRVFAISGKFEKFICIWSTTFPSLIRERRKFNMFEFKRYFSKPEKNTLDKEGRGRKTNGTTC